MLEPAAAHPLGSVQVPKPERKWGLLVSSRCSLFQFANNSSKFIHESFRRCSCLQSADQRTVIPKLIFFCSIEPLPQAVLKTSVGASGFVRYPEGSTSRK